VGAIVERLPVSPVQRSESARILSGAGIDSCDPESPHRRFMIVIASLGPPLMAHGSWPMTRGSIKYKV
jgi:hypothetical protein